jgi:hypothetical protein
MVATMTFPLYRIKYLKRLAAKVKRTATESLRMAFREHKENPQEQVVRRLNNVLDEYVQGSPSDQNALDIFKGEWSSQLPGAWKELKAGTVTLFDDARILWAADQLGGFKGQRVIELGPLEAGHTYMLESLGAESILAIEANKRAYLKCLIAKEILGLRRSRFVLGDFVSFLRENDTPFDVCLASGVLYHMQNPCEFIHLISKASKKVVLWTHYFDEKVIQSKNNPAKFSGTIRQNYNGFDHVLQVCLWRLLSWEGLRGGHSYVTGCRGKTYRLVAFFGFQDLNIGFEVRPPKWTLLLYSWAP